MAQAAHSRGKHLRDAYVVADVWAAVDRQGSTVDGDAFMICAPAYRQNAIAIASLYILYEA